MKRVILIASIGWLLASCQQAMSPVQYSYAEVRIDSTQRGNSEMSAHIQPYKKSLDSIMQQVLCVNEHALQKQRPNGSLNSFLADVVLSTANAQLQNTVHASLINYGGIRLPELPAGNITVGKIYELLPFDNYLVVLPIRGDTLQELLDATAAAGGWPVAGISYHLHNAKAEQVKVNGQALDPHYIYRVVMADYIANGGDNMNMLRSLPQTSLGLLQRDAVIEYLKQLHQSGQPIHHHGDQRISIAHE